MWCPRYHQVRALGTPTVELVPQDPNRRVLEALN